MPCAFYSVTLFICATCIAAMRVRRQEAAGLRSAHRASGRIVAQKVHGWQPEGTACCMHHSSTCWMGCMCGVGVSSLCCSRRLAQSVR
jgi:hypothetical protein